MPILAGFLKFYQTKLKNFFILICLSSTNLSYAESSFYNFETNDEDFSRNSSSFIHSTGRNKIENTRISPTVSSFNIDLSAYDISESELANFGISKDDFHLKLGTNLKNLVFKYLGTEKENKELQKKLADLSSPDLKDYYLPIPSGLSIDGGGVRGIGAATILEQVETVAGVPITELFDFWAGASAGEILVALATEPSDKDNPLNSKPVYNAYQVKTIFEKNIPKIFKPNPYSLYGFWGPKYLSTSFYDVCNEHLQDSLFSQTTNHRIAVTYDTNKCSPKIIRSYDRKEEFLTKHVVSASAAAPTYFSAFNLFPVNASAHHQGYPLIDGGMTANNPALFTYSEMVNNFPDAPTHRIFSIGTGNGCKPLTYDNIKDGSNFTWMKYGVNTFMNGANTATNHALNQIFNKKNDGGFFMRFNTELEGEHTALDNISQENISYLKRKAERLVNTRSKDFNYMIEELLKRSEKPKFHFFDRKKSASDL